MGASGKNVLFKKKLSPQSWCKKEYMIFLWHALMIQFSMLLLLVPALVNV